MWATAFVLVALAAQGSDPSYLAARAKLDSILHDSVAPDSTVVFSAREVNAYVRAMLPRYVPQGIRDTSVVLGKNQVTGSAEVNFIELARSLGTDPNPILKQLVDGAYPVSVGIDVWSKDGLVRVDLKRVTISGHTIEGALLDFLVRNIFLARFPQARIGEPFELEHGVRAIRVRPQGVGVRVGR
jgi:hypothetical protein